MLANFDNFQRIREMTLKTMRPSSQRVYRQTYELWLTWCKSNDVDTLNLHPDNVLGFLISRHVTRSTRQRQYAAMRKLLQVMALTSEDARKAFEYLKLVPMPEDNLSDNERDTQVLTPDQIKEVVRVWDGVTNIQRRNAAMVWVLVSTAMRRAECVSLQWRDIDLERGVIHIRHGKRGKQRQSAIVYDQAIEALQLWREINNGKYVFRPMDNKGVLLEDEPIGVDNLYRIIKQVEVKSGVVLTPHTLRRTLATELIANGASIADVQEQLGHSKASTLLEHYVKAADAQQRRKRFKGHMGK